MEQLVQWPWEWTDRKVAHVAEAGWECHGGGTLERLGASTQGLKVPLGFWLLFEESRDATDEF